MRVGVLADTQLWEWQRLALKKIQRIDGVELSMVVVDESTAGTYRDVADGGIGIDEITLFTESLLDGRFYALVSADEKLEWMVRNGETRRRYLRSHGVDDVAVLSNADVVRTTPVDVDENWSELPDHVVDDVVDRTDVVVRFGFGLLTGRIIDEPEYGVVSVHGTDIREFRGLGPQLLVLNGKETATVTLQQLTDDIDGGRVVCMLRRELEKPYTLSEVWRTVNEIQTDIYAEGIERLTDPSFEPSPPDQLGEYYSTASKHRLSFVARLLWKNNVARVKKTFA